MDDRQGQRSFDFAVVCSDCRVNKWLRTVLGKLEAFYVKEFTYLCGFENFYILEIKFFPLGSFFLPFSSPAGDFIPSCLLGIDFLKREGHVIMEHLIWHCIGCYFFPSNLLKLARSLCLPKTIITFWTGSWSQSCWRRVWVTSSSNYIGVTPHAYADLAINVHVQMNNRTNI